MNLSYLVSCGLASGGGGGFTGVTAGDCPGVILPGIRIGGGTGGNGLRVTAAPLLATLFASEAAALLISLRNSRKRKWHCYVTSSDEQTGGQHGARCQRIEI